jgi:cytochrome c
MRMIAAYALLAKGARSALLAFAVLSIGATSASAQLRGHGGPVRALAISPDGLTAISGSFDSTAIRWSLAHNAAEQVLRFHSDAVNAVAWLRDGRMATAGADGRIAIWTSGRPEPDAVLEGHTAPIVALAASSDGMTLASASWDHTVRLWPLAGGAPRVLEEHTQNVNGVAFSADGRAVVSVSYDQSVRIWPLSGSQPPTVVVMPTPLNSVAVGADGEIAVGGADGKVYFIAGNGTRAGEVQAVPRPVISIAISPDGAQVAAASIGGAVAVIDRKARSLARTLVGPGLPVWSVAFMPDGRTILTGGADNIIRRWNPATGEPVDTVLVETAGDPLAAYAGDRGPIFSAPASPVTRWAPIRPTGQGLRCQASSVDASRLRRATISPTRSSVSTSSGRPRRSPNCSRLGRRPIRPVPRCPSSASARSRTAPRWWNF